MLRPAVFPLTELLALGLAASLALGACADAPAPKSASSSEAGQVTAKTATTKPATAKPATTKPATTKPATAKAATAKAATAKAATREPGACAQAGSGSRAGARGEGGHGERCEGASEPLRNPTQVRVTTPTGQQAVHLGDAFAPAGQIPTVTVSALLSAPDKWAGKKIRVQGDVTAMCHHKRGWFAVAAEDKSGRALRVITTPVFLVPQGSIGRGAVAEGRVDVIEIAARFARHMANDHKLGDPAKMQGPQRQVILRAAGAEFR